MKKTKIMAIHDGEEFGQIVGKFRIENKEEGVEGTGGMMLITKDAYENIIKKRKVFDVVVIVVEFDENKDFNADEDIISIEDGTEDCTIVMGMKLELPFYTKEEGDMVIIREFPFTAERVGKGRRCE